MQDGIIAGTGNSRYPKTVAEALTLYPTYQDFIASLIAGTFPIDLNGINSTGWTQEGTPLNKANLLTDATASLIGLSSDATPNDAFQTLRNLVVTAQITADGKSRLVVGTYTGNAPLSGFQEETDYSQKISLSFLPKAVFVLQAGYRLENNDHYNGQYYVCGGLAVTNHPAEYQPPSSSAKHTILSVAANGFFVHSWKDSIGGDSYYIAANNGGAIYHYIALG